MRNYFKTMIKKQPVSPIKETTGKTTESTKKTSISVSNRMATAASRVNTRGSSGFSERAVDEQAIIKRKANYTSYHQGVDHIQVEANTQRLSDNSFVLGDGTSASEVVVNFN